jgi:hypothetical protein
VLAGLGVLSLVINIPLVLHFDRHSVRGHPSGLK